MIRLRLEMKNCNTILTQKQQKSELDHLEILININILQVTKYYLLTKKELQNKLSLLVLL